MSPALVSGEGVIAEAPLIGCKEPSQTGQFSAVCAALVPKYLAGVIGDTPENLLTVITATVYLK
jgi:hypothetical protein